jgi:hypothetical protein
MLVFKKIGRRRRRGKVPTTMRMCIAVVSSAAIVVYLWVLVGF